MWMTVGSSPLPDRGYRLVMRLFVAGRLRESGAYLWAPAADGGGTKRVAGAQLGIAVDIRRVP